MSGDFSLTAGEKLYLLVGQQGLSHYNYNGSGGSRPKSMIFSGHSPDIVRGTPIRDEVPRPPGLGRRAVTQINIKRNSYSSAMCKSQENLVKVRAKFLIFCNFLSNLSLELGHFSQRKNFLIKLRYSTRRKMHNIWRVKCQMHQGKVDSMRIHSIFDQVTYGRRKNPNLPNFDVQNMLLEGLNFCRNVNF